MPLSYVVQIMHYFFIGEVIFYRFHVKDGGNGTKAIFRKVGERWFHIFRSGKKIYLVWHLAIFYSIWLMAMDQE